jgi:hypothetical protein
MLGKQIKSVSWVSATSISTARRSRSLRSAWRRERAIIADGATELESGAFHNCALIGDQWLRCWGQNDAGELGPFAGDDAPI